MKLLVWYAMSCAPKDRVFLGATPSGEGFVTEICYWGSYGHHSDPSIRCEGWVTAVGGEVFSISPAAWTPMPQYEGIVFDYN